MNIFEVLLLAIGLAMDAFAVSICKGLAIRKISTKDYLLCGVWFGSFQTIMPLLGYIAGSTFERWIRIVGAWVAFILLMFIGVNMIREAFSSEEELTPGMDIRTMFMLAVATSIDALAVGVTFVAVPVEIIGIGGIYNVLIAVIIIGIVTFIISIMGVRIGSIFGARYRSRAEIIGGIILIAIGVKTLIQWYLQS